ncbi:MAG: CbtA family protein [Alphaproteobacteria bacterium]
MLKRVLAAALLAGLCAGVFTGVLQVLYLQPLILEAERYEVSELASQSSIHAPNHDHAVAETAQGATSTTTAPHSHRVSLLPPREELGVERVLFLVITNLLTGIGFSLILAAAYTFLAPRLDLSLDIRTGALWGLVGFAAFSLAPALGLPPELPGMAAADLSLRQAWWVFTALSTATGLGILAFGRTPLWGLVGAGLLIFPHMIGAPAPLSGEIAVPAELLVDFITLSLSIMGVFWLVLGLCLGFSYPKSSERVSQLKPALG